MSVRRDYVARRTIDRTAERARLAKWQRENRVKVLAHKAVYRAVKRGDLVRKPCEVCGETKVYAHHDDYSKQLDVRWLCGEHHMREHWKEDSDGHLEAVTR